MKLVISIVLFGAVLILILCLKFFIHDPFYLAFAEGYLCASGSSFVGWTIFELWKNPHRKQISSYARRETHYDGGGRILTKTTVKESR